MLCHYYYSLAFVMLWMYKASVATKNMQGSRTAAIIECAKMKQLKQKQMGAIDSFLSGKTHLHVSANRL